MADKKVTLNHLVCIISSFFVGSSKNDATTVVSRGVMSSEFFSGMRNAAILGPRTCLSPPGRRCQKARLVKIWATLLGAPGKGDEGDIWQVEVLEVLVVEVVFCLVVGE